MRSDNFEKFVHANKASGKNWYDGLNGKWWWNMSDNDAIIHMKQSRHKSAIDSDKIVLVSTWGINCGIATYTGYLMDNLDKISHNSFVVDPINGGTLKYKIKDGLTHIQHEYGIIPHPPKIKGKVIVTWHTVSNNTNDTVKKFESNYDVVAHIVHSECARSEIDSSKDIWTIPHGSMLIPEMRKEDARNILGINKDIPIGFVFGFQSGDKNYQRLIDAAKNTDIHLIISGARHSVANPVNIPNETNVTFINRFLTENEVNLYALASDILLFDYSGKDHYSVSGALHRIIGSGRPIVCSDVRHFNDVRHITHCLKFKDQKKLEESIIHALKSSDRLGIAARKYAEKYSWENIAKKHIVVYKKYSDII